MNKKPSLSICLLPLSHSRSVSPGYRLDELAQAEMILTSGQVWQTLFTEPLPDVAVCLKGGHAVTVITTLLTAIWEQRRPVWEDETLLHHIGDLIDHIQREDDWDGAMLSALEVACLDVYLTLGLRFAQYFPDDKTWAANVPALDEAGLAAGIEAFLTAINEHYFPVEEEVWVDEIEFMAGRLQVIDLMPAGYDLNPDYADPDQFAEPVRTLLYLAAAEWNTHFPGLAFTDETEDQLAISLDGLSRIILTMPLPAPIQKGLPTLLDLVTHCTGNAWLDWSYGALAEGGVMLPEWHPDNVAFLKQEWQAAQALIAIEQAFIDWVAADESTRLPAVRSAVYLAYINQRNLFYVPDRPGSRDHQHLSRSHHSGKSADRWLSYHPSYLPG